MFRVLLLSVAILKSSAQPLETKQHTALMAVLDGLGEGPLRKKDRQKDSLFFCWCVCIRLRASNLPSFECLGILSITDVVVKMCGWQRDEFVSVDSDLARVEAEVISRSQPTVFCFAEIFPLRLC
jgi:hypothetical protein